MKIFLAVCVIGLGLVGCSSKPIALPSNVSTIPSGMGESTYIDKIDHSFIPEKVVNFSQIKLCAASTFTNDTITLKDNAGSFLGAYTGNYYQKHNTQQVAGGNIFKFVDDQNQTLVATGNKKTRAQQGGLIVDYIKYDAKVILSNNNIRIVFQNLQAAQQSTGSSSNDGFRSIGTWPGARAPAAIETINVVAASFKSCLN